MVLSKLQIAGSVDEKKEIKFQSKKIIVKQSDADIVSANHWKDKVLPVILQDYNTSCTYNCGKTVLYYGAMPGSILCLKERKLFQEKFLKTDWLFHAAVMLMVVIKCHFFVIGKSKSPWYFKGIKSPQVQYEANYNA